MERPTCKTCPYFEPPHIFLTEAFGECRSHPEFQPKRKFDWCGEHPGFKAYIASLKKPRTVPEMEAEIAAIQDEIGTAIYESVKEFGMTAPEGFNSQPPHGDTSECR